MREKNQLGMFWGNDGVYVAETANSEPKNMFLVPFHGIPKPSNKKGALDTEGSNFAASLKAALGEHRITISHVQLSLPTKDIIFRSFVIPWMQQHEVRNVVQFEVSKYIPFSLKDLSYAYHPLIVTENNVKIIRVVFVAIKKETLDHYVRILKAASLEVKTVEPSASSLIRTLNLKNLIPNKETVALIDKENVGRIIITDNGIPQFVREFYLFPASQEEDEEKEGPAETAKKLINEVRISLDYFNRQNEYLHVNKILYLSSTAEEDLHATLQTQLNIPSVTIADQLILQDAAHRGIGYLHAFGASLIGQMEGETTFDLSENNPDHLPEKKTFQPKPFEFKPLIATSLLCLTLAAGGIVLSQKSIQTLKDEVSSLNLKLGSFRDSDVTFIEQKDKLANDKLTYFQQTRINSDTAALLVIIPELLPEETWLEKFEIRYDDSAVFNSAQAKLDLSGNPRTALGTARDTPSLILTLEGYAYSESKTKQFRIVDMLLRALKNNQILTGIFETIDLETTGTQKIEDYDVTSFKIVCKQSDEH